MHAGGRHTRFGGLGRLVDQDGPKLELAQSRIASPDTGAADDVRGAENLLLARADEGLVLSLVVRAQLALLVLELDELLQLEVHGVIRDLLVERQEGDGGIQGLARLCGETDDFEARCVYLLGELIDGNVGRGTDEDLAGVHLGEVVDDGGRGDGLAGSGRAL